MNRWTCVSCVVVSVGVGLFAVRPVQAGEVKGKDAPDASKTAVAGETKEAPPVVMPVRPGFQPPRGAGGPGGPGGPGGLGGGPGGPGGPGMSRPPSLTTNDLPAAVQQTLIKELPTLVPENISKRGGSAGAAETYYIYGKADGTESSISITADGKVVTKSEPIDPAKVPKSVLEAMEKAMKPPTFDKARKSMGGGMEVYQLEGTAGGLSYRVWVTSDGQVNQITANRQQSRPGMPGTPGIGPMGVRQPPRIGLPPEKKDEPKDVKAEEKK